MEMEIQNQGRTEESAQRRAPLDISGWKTMPEILWLAEFFFLPVVVTSLDTGRFLLANKAARLYFAMQQASLDSFCARSFWVDPAERERFVRLLDSLGEIHDFPFQARLQDGSLRKLTVSARKVVMEGEPACFAAIQDRTDLIHAQETAQEQLRRYNLLAENMRDVVWVLDPEHRLTFVSPSIESMLGYTVQELEMLEPFAWLPRSVVELPGLFDQDASASQSAGAQELYAEMIRKDGCSVWTHSLVRRVQGGVMIGVTRDVSDQVRIQRELDCASEAVEIASRVKTEFLANMSHEIRTPLNGIMGMLQILQSTPLDEEQLDCVDTALISCRSLLGVIGDILDFSRIEAGQVKLSAEWFDLPGVVQSLIRSFQGMVGHKNVQLTARIDPNVPRTIMTDNARLRQILFNLLSNAVKFTPSGSIELAVCIESRDNDHAILGFTLTDTGIGIAPQRIRELFEPFTQADGSHTRKYSGTGLGLTLVQRLVVLLGGVVDVRSREGEGTTVWFTLPVSIESGTESSETEPFGKEMGEEKKLRILLVDDDRFNEKVVANMLRRNGFEVTGTSNGRLALEELQHAWFDLMILDIQMPEMDGIEVTRRVRTDPAYAHVVDIPIIALTAHAMTGDRERFLGAGMDAYLSKPVDMQEMLGAIARVLRPVRK